MQHVNKYVQTHLVNSEVVKIGSGCVVLCLQSAWPIANREPPTDKRNNYFEIDHADCKIIVKNVSWGVRNLQSAVPIANPKHMSEYKTNWHTSAFYTLDVFDLNARHVFKL